MVTGLCCEQKVAGAVVRGGQGVGRSKLLVSLDEAEILTGNRPTKPPVLALLRQRRAGLPALSVSRRDAWKVRLVEGLISLSLLR